MTSSFLINRVAPIAGMAVFGALAALAIRDPRWLLVILPLLLGFMSFSTNYGYRGHDAKRAARDALHVIILSAVIFAVVYLFGGHHGS